MTGDSAALPTPPHPPADEVSLDEAVLLGEELIRLLDLARAHDLYRAAAYVEKRLWPDDDEDDDDGSD